MKKTEVTTETTNSKSSNETLLAFLKREGYNQATFAKAIGVQRATVNGWCRAGKQPRIATFFRIGSLLDKTPEEVNQHLGFNVDVQDYVADTVPLKIQLRGLQLQVAALTQLVQQLMAA